MGWQWCDVSQTRQIRKYSVAQIERKYNIYRRIHKNIIIIGNLFETHRRTKWLIGNPLETNITDQRLHYLIWDRHAWSQRHIGDRHAWPSKSDELLMWHVRIWWGMLVSDETCWSPMRHVHLWWGMLVSDGLYWSWMRYLCLQWEMLVSNQLNTDKSQLNFDESQLNTDKSQLITAEN